MMNMKKMVYLLILTLVVSAVPGVYAAGDSASALFSAAEPTTNGMQVGMQLGVGVTTKESGGKTGWVLNPKDSAASFVRCKIDKDVMYEFKERGHRRSDGRISG